MILKCLNGNIQQHSVRSNLSKTKEKIINTDSIRRLNCNILVIYPFNAYLILQKFQNHFILGIFLFKKHEYDIMLDTAYRTPYVIWTHMAEPLYH